jgi:hypothetical protein
VPDRPDASSVAAAPDPGPTAPPSADAAAPAPAPDPEPAAAATEWWQKCHSNRRCIIDWSGLKGGISIRKGRFEHAQKVDWQLTFARAPRIDIVPTDAPLPVDVRAVALDSNGAPVAAEITWQKSHQETVVGIIALQVGDRRISMTPID